MVTVYERIRILSKRQGFQLHPKHKLFIGNLAAKKYREQGGSKDDLTLVQSEEENGTWMVTAYPDTFRATLNKIITDYITNLKLVGKKKAIIEKPADEPTKRKRTRKPVPFFSLRK